VIVESDAQVLPGKWVVPSSALALVAPDVGMPRVARRERILVPFLIVLFCSLLAAGATSYRVDARDATLTMLDQSGQLKTMSDRQIEDQTKDAERAFVVKTVAKGVLGPPFNLGVLCLGLLGLSWFVRGRSKGKAVAAVAATAMLPGAIENLLQALAVLRKPFVPTDGPPAIPADLASLWAQVSGHPLAGPAARLLGAFDVFSLWGALLVGYGLATAANLPLRRAMTATLVGWLCLHVLFAAATGLVPHPGPQGGPQP
jgi:hypothetical protein